MGNFFDENILFVVLLDFIWVDVYFNFLFPRFPTATVSHGSERKFKKNKMEMEESKATHIQIEDEHIDSNHNDTVRTHEIVNHVNMFL